jgi:lysophospholipase L1-like esterase
MKFILRPGLALVFLALVLPAAFGADGEQGKHNFAVWNREISAYVQRDATNPPPKNGILFIGSSTIRLWTTLAADFPGEPVINRGFGGSEIADSTHFAPQILFPYQPRKVFLRAGGNDLAAGEPVKQVFADFKDFAETVHAKVPDTIIYYISWGPTPSRWKQHDKEKELNSLIAGYIKGKPYLQYIETYDMPLGTNGLPRSELFRPDQLHYNTAGYKLLAARVRPYVN